MTDNHMENLFKPRNMIDVVLFVFAVIGFYSVYNDLTLFEQGMAVGSLLTFFMIAAYYLLGKTWGYIIKFKNTLDKEDKKES